MLIEEISDDSDFLNSLSPFFTFTDLFSVDIISELCSLYLYAEALKGLDISVKDIINVDPSFGVSFSGVTFQSFDSEKANDFFQTNSIERDCLNFVCKQSQQIVDPFPHIIRDWEPARYFGSRQGAAKYFKACKSLPGFRTFLLDAPEHDDNEEIEAVDNHYDPVLNSWVTVEEEVSIDITSDWQMVTLGV